MSETEKNLNLEDKIISNPKRCAFLCAKWLDEKQGADITVFYVEEKFQIADYFVIVSGKASRHLKGMASFLEDKLKEYDIKPIGIEGYQEGLWILVDLGDVVVHIMSEKIRDFYDLEHLWGDCPRIQWQGKTV